MMSFRKVCGTNRFTRIGKTGMAHTMCSLTQILRFHIFTTARMIPKYMYILWSGNASNQSYAKKDTSLWYRRTFERIFLYFWDKTFGCWEVLSGLSAVQQRRCPILADKYCAGHPPGLNRTLTRARWRSIQIGLFWADAICVWYFIIKDLLQQFVGIWDKVNNMNRK